MSADVADRLMQCLETNVMPDRQLTGDARARIVWLEAQLAEAQKNSVVASTLRHMEEMRRVLGDPMKPFQGAAINPMHSLTGVDRK
jgi:hypothetical protein